MKMNDDGGLIIPESGAVFTFGRSRFADNLANKFWIKNDPVINISCGDEHSAVQTERGRVYVFGSNDWGQLGLGHKKSSNKPSFIKALKPEKIVAISCGRNHTMLYSESRKLFTFGGNEDSQLGHPDKKNELTPRQVEAFPKIKLKQLSCGAYHSAVLTDKGDVYTWGQNVEGQCGFNMDDEIKEPRKHDFDERVVSISCGYYHTALVTASGIVYTFGENENGKLGLSGTQLNETRMPQPLPSLKNDKYTKVACGARHTVALTEYGVCYSWGDGSHGQLGHGTMVLELTQPRKIELLNSEKIIDVACGDSHTAVITDEYKVFTFGDGRHGKLGQGDECFSNLFKPTLIKSFKGFMVIGVSCGGCHTLVQAVEKKVDYSAESEEEGGALQNSMSDSLHEANKALKPGNFTFPGVSPRDKRRLKDDVHINSLSLNSSLNNGSFTMAQMSKTVAELPKDLDRNRLPKIPGLELAPDKAEKISCNESEEVDDTKPLEPKRLVAEISFTRNHKDKIRLTQTKSKRKHLQKDATNNNMGPFEEIGNTNKENHTRNKRSIGLANIHENRNDVLDINNSESEESEYEAGSEELLKANNKRKKKLKKKFEFEQSLKRTQTEKKIKRKEKTGTDEQFESEEEGEEDEVNKIDSEETNDDDENSYEENETHAFKARSNILVESLERENLKGRKRKEKLQNIQKEVKELDENDDEENYSDDEVEDQEEQDEEEDKNEEEKEKVRNTKSSKIKPRKGKIQVMSSKSKRSVKEKNKTEQQTQKFKNTKRKSRKANEEYEDSDEVVDEEEEEEEEDEEEDEEDEEENGKDEIENINDNEELEKEDAKEVDEQISNKNGSKNDGKSKSGFLSFFKRSKKQAVEDVTKSQERLKNVNDIGSSKTCSIL